MLHTSSSRSSILRAIFLPDYTLPKLQCHQQQQINTLPITSPTSLLHPLRQYRHSHHVLVGLTGMPTFHSHRVSGQHWAGIEDGTETEGKDKTYSSQQQHGFHWLKWTTKPEAMSKSAWLSLSKSHLSQHKANTIISSSFEQQNEW